jgi:hypothetical protein
MPSGRVSALNSLIFAAMIASLGFGDDSYHFNIPGATIFSDVDVLILKTKVAIH